MSINYAGLHLIGENYVTRPLSQQTYTNKMADAIHGMEAYIVPRKVDNTYKKMFEDLCNSPQINHIRSVMHNSRARFGDSSFETNDGPPAEEPPPAGIPPTKGQLKSAVKQQAKDAASEKKGGVHFEAKEAIDEAKRLSSAKKKAQQAATPKGKGIALTGHSKPFYSAISEGTTGKTPVKSEKTTAKKKGTPRNLIENFEEVAPTEAPTPNIKGIKRAKGLNLKSIESPKPEAKAAPAPEAKAAPAPTEKAEISRAAKINAFITQTDDANGIVTIIQATGKGGKGFRPAYIGHDGVTYGYLDGEVSKMQLKKMAEALEKVKGKVPDAEGETKKAITNYISRIKTEITKRG